MQDIISVTHVGTTQCFNYVFNLFAFFIPFVLLQEMLSFLVIFSQLNSENNRKIDDIYFLPYP